MHTGEFFSFATGDLPLIWITLTYICFVADKHEYDVRLCMLFDFRDPSLDVFEGLFFSYVIYEEGTQTLSIMCRRNGLKSFLTSYKCFKIQLTKSSNN